MSGRLGRSKRKRLEVQEPLGTGSSGTGSGSSGSSSFRLAQQASASGSISIEEIDLEGKFVQLKNSSDKVRPPPHLWGGPRVFSEPWANARPLCQDQSLGNWRIKRQILEGEEIAYKFTPKYVLRAGQTVTVGGCGESGQDVRCGCDGVGGLGWGWRALQGWSPGAENSCLLSQITCVPVFLHPGFPAALGRA